MAGGGEGEESCAGHRPTGFRGSLSFGRRRPGPRWPHRATTLAPFFCDFMLRSAPGLAAEGGWDCRELDSHIPFAKKSPASPPRATHATLFAWPATDCGGPWRPPLIRGRAASFEGGRDPGLGARLPLAHEARGGHMRRWCARLLDEGAAIRATRSQRRPRRVMRAAEAGATHHRGRRCWQRETNSLKTWRIPNLTGRRPKRLGRSPPRRFRRPMNRISSSWLLSRGDDAIMGMRPGKDALI